MKLNMAGETALSRHSMLNGPVIPVVAAYKQSELLHGMEIIDEKWQPEKELVRVEFWKYDPEPFAFDGCVDPVSLAESLKDIPDERVQGELEDYLEEFTAYIKEHINEVAALSIICTRPAELTRQSLKELSLQLDRDGYAPTQLDSAISAINAEEAGADIISIIRRYAIGARLMNHREKVEQAVKRLRANHNFTKMQDTWIELMKNYLLNEPVLNRAAFDEDFRLRKQGGSARADKLLDGQLNPIIAELNEYMYDDGGKSA
jgi:type I site-specific restriction endonuclease